MDAARWREQQQDLREAVRHARAPGGGDASSAPTTEPRAQVSVIVVCWNVEDVLGRCLEQLLAQDYPHYEIIVVDDGSEDGTLRVAEDASPHGEVTIVRSPANRGCPHARNLGILRASGEIVAFLDADGFADRRWLSNVVRAFEGDPGIGGVASTVFFAGNPMVINGAGGIVNRQGWAADLSMNESYEHAEIAPEALYPMGCGMAVRRSALERVGPFDDRMLNYYDDVDYGIRLWRAGYRVRVSGDAWIDHGFGQGGGSDSGRKQLLCERHRMRVVLKHAPPGTLRRWAAHEARTLGAATWPRRGLKLRAIAWNVRNLASVLADRRALRGAVRPPERLVDDSWGDGFPAGLPVRLRPRPEAAEDRIDMAEVDSEERLLYGWFPRERVDGRSYRWAGLDAATLITLTTAVRRLHLDFVHAPVDTGGIELRIRRLDGGDPLAPVWSTRLAWQYIARSVENHPLALTPGDYEVVFEASRGWSDPPRESRLLGFALSRMSFEEAYEIPVGGLDMASPGVEDQLVSGWFEGEGTPERTYRWASAHAEAAVRLGERAGSMQMSYRLPPGPTGGVQVSLRAADAQSPAFSTRIAWREGDWQEDTFQLGLEAGDYVVSFDAEATWSNPGRGDPDLPPENRSLGFALSSLRFR